VQEVYTRLSRLATPKARGNVIPNRAESPVRNLLFSAIDLNARAHHHPPAENRDARGGLKLR